MEPDNKNTEIENILTNAKQKFSELETEYTNFTDLKNKLKCHQLNRYANQYF